MLKRFLPQETSFFDFFEEHAALTIDACKELVSLFEPGCNIPAKVARIAQLENETDGITHRCIKALQKTFITPIDRAHIHDLIKALDDIIDSVDEASSRIMLYEIKDLRPEAKAMAEVILEAMTAISQALKELYDLRNEQAIKRNCIAVHRYENEGDGILRAAIVRLFKEESGNPVVIIKWKEIFEQLEMASDRCEDVADILQGIIIEAS